MRLLLGRLALLAVPLALWELLPRAGLVDPELLPPFSAAGAAMLAMLARPAVRADLALSASEIAAAVLASVPLGLALGLLIGESRRVARAIEPLVFFAFGIPKSIFLPLFILTLGIGFPEKLAFGVASTVLVVTVSTAAAVRSVRPEHRLVARSYAASPWQVARLVYWPSMLPVLLEGVRTALVFAVTAIMLAEVYAARAGFGHRLADWGENFAMPELMGGVLLVSVLAVAVNEALRAAENRCGRWRS